MALTDILERIKKETAEQTEKLKQEYDEKKKRLDEEDKKAQKEIDEDLHQKVEERSKKMLEKAENLADQERKNQLLFAKRKFIDKVLTSAIDELADSPDYEKILVDMLKKADLDDANTVVVPAKGKEDKTKKAIKESGKTFFLSEKSADIKGGFILKTDKVEIDNSFETIIGNQLRGDLEIDLNKLLFQ